MTDKDRIRLAEAMGWKRLQFDDKRKRRNWLPPGKPEEQIYWCKQEHELPNPFKDANDDYAVLEWMHTQDWFSYGYLNTIYDEFWDYKIGDYARAALKVLDNEALQEGES